ncbi:MAG: hypothetical protein LBV66_01855 [Elusimicrobiota bacterium]|jgi:3-deoxy-D-manno-octulosonic-acid transferase|nr:hypothetical protein [Elusimicrobiota bacterium]
MTAILLFIYNFLFASLLIILAIPAFIFSKRFRTELNYNLSERFALIKPFVKENKKIIWFHCASLGEVRAIEPVLDKLKNDFSIVLTVNTKTGREYAANIKDIAMVSLFPLDIYPLMLKFLDKVKPDLFILVETELWASMLYAAHKKKVKTVVVNARISDKTYNIYRKLGFFWKPLIGFIDIVLARSKEDGDRFAFFSGGNMKVSVTGNIKYDRDFSLSAAREKMGLTESDIVFTAGSTREGEERIIARVYKRIIAKYPDIKFFLAPRHINRIDEIKTILDSMSIKYSLFSKAGAQNNFIIIDTFGKLQDIYSVSDICFVGGSIVNKGGQNPIEPAAYAKPVLFGRYMQNFKTEADILLSYGGAVKVSTTVGLTRQILKLLSDKNMLKEMGENALYAVKSQRGAVSAATDKIKELLK